MYGVPASGEAPPAPQDNARTNALRCPWLCLRLLEWTVTDQVGEMTPEEEFDLRMAVVDADCARMVAEDRADRFRCVLEQIWTNPATATTLQQMAKRALE